MQNLQGPTQDPLVANAQDINSIMSLIHHFLTQYGQSASQAGDKQVPLATILSALTVNVFKRLFDSRSTMLLEDSLVTVLKVLRHHEHSEASQVVVPEFTRQVLVWLSASVNKSGGGMLAADRKFTTHGDLIIRCVIVRVWCE